MRNWAAAGGAPDQAGQRGHSRGVAALRAVSGRADPAPCLGRRPARPLITSATNPRLKLVRKLEARRQRDKLGLFVCEGEDLVEAALDAGLQPAEALVDGERPALQDRLPAAEVVAPALMAELSTLAHP